MARLEKHPINLCIMSALHSKKFAEGAHLGTKKERNDFFRKERRMNDFLKISTGAKKERFRKGKIRSSGEPNVRFGINLVAELFGSVEFFRLLLNSSVRRTVRQNSGRTVRLVGFGRTSKLGKFGSAQKIWVRFTTHSV